MRVKLQLVCVFLCTFTQGAWIISHQETTGGQKTGDVRIIFLPDREDGFEPFEAAVDELKRRGRC